MLGLAFPEAKGQERWRDAIDIPGTDEKLRQRLEGGFRPGSTPGRGAPRLNAPGRGRVHHQSPGPAC